MIKIMVDDKEIEVEEGISLLQACLDAGIYVPNLCYLEGMEDPAASCRMCFVEIEGEEKPLPSCTTQVSNGMVVKTDTPSVRRLQRWALRLLLSVHDVDCARCPANKKCELQHIAKFLKVGLKPKRLERILKETQIDEVHPFLNYYPNRCVLCGKCVVVCQRQHGQPQLTFANRGFDTVISLYGERGGPQSTCGECTVCIDICPVGALTRKDPCGADEQE